MASAAGGGGRGSVGRRLGASVAVNFFVLVVVGVAGIIGTTRAHDSVDYLAKQVEPAATVNADALQELTDAETYVWGYGISGEQSLLDKYVAARTRFRENRARLERLRSLDPQLGLLVDDFLLSAQNWFAAYADPRTAGPVGLGTFDALRFDRAQVLFADVRTTNAAVSERVRELSTAAERSSNDLERSLVIMLVGVLVAGAAGSLFVARRSGQQVTEPLGALEETAQRLARGDHAARAPVTGPREVVQVASAINRMADENDRARAVESRVVDQLRALDAVKSDFVSNVSHELRTPLTSILGYLELLEEELVGRTADTEQDMLRAAKRNVLRLGELIEDLLALTRSESQGTELKELDLASLTRDLVTDLRVASSQQGVEIRLGVPAAPVPVMADAGQIARVVTNLVSNAVKFSQGASEVAVSVVRDGDDAVLTVEDHGIGIPSEELDQLGSRFYRASNAVHLGITGTGLGLRIVQAIVENHHGSVDLRSVQGVGTTVWVRLPVLQPDESHRADAADSTDPAEVG
ncbi:ATP-binding protein [Nocardioides pocheonensis]|uniref:Sensor-like histidine kinase SenX3 n=1 Tax=Nocardioides pocheonensis TaxID=661485 RepID=A0A3N0GS35_9ACTN|nr:ATP-binding protein [Nocardioides pocheonensis]RNM15287.1 HAMP domain-containing protein [Nocardioides pocheonensis]